MAQQITSERVARRPLAELSRAALGVVPVVVAFVTALAARQLLTSQFALPWPITAAVALVVAVSVVVGVDRAAHRLLPLTMLLNLAIIFPDQVPSRLAMAMRANSPKRLRHAVQSNDLHESQAAASVVELVTALTEHDRLTRGHSERVRAVTMMIADEMNIHGEDRDRLEWGALLHDIGKIEVSSLILNKPGAPDDTEWLELSGHPTKGVVVAGELAQWLGDSIHAIDQHHEHFDGSGYPAGLRGEQISQSARIVAVADAYEVMTANRSYKSAMSPAQARRELTACSGSQFDPQVVRALVSVSVGRFNHFLGLGAWSLAMLL